MIAWLVPTRCRPHNIAALIDAWERTADGGHGQLVVCVDGDPDADQYRELELPEWAWLTVGPRRRLGGTLNFFAPRYAGHTGVGFMGDDHRPRTKGWDRRFAEALSERAVVYGDDLLQGQQLATHVAIESSVIRTLGYMVPPGIQHMFVDNFWMLLGQQMGTLTYLDDVVVEHCHPLAHKAEWDPSYTDSNREAQYAHDHDVFARFLRERWPHDLARLTMIGAAP